MKRACLVIFVLIGLCIVNATAADRIRPKITLSQAQELALATMTPEQFELTPEQFQRAEFQLVPAGKFPKNIDAYKDINYPKFIWIHFTWRDGFKDAYYYINPYTGDIFDPGSTSCDGYHNKKLDVIQKEVRQSLRLTDAEYKKIKVKNPICEDKSMISVDQALSLAFATLTPKQLRLPGLQILKPDKDQNNINAYRDSFNPKFISFQLIWDGLPDSNILVGNYTINPYTGDIFDTGSGDCYGFTNKKLRILQKKIRHSLKLTDTEYKKIKVVGPMC